MHNGRGSSPKVFISWKSNICIYVENRPFLEHQVKFFHELFTAHETVFLTTPRAENYWALKWYSYFCGIWHNQDSAGMVISGNYNNTPLVEISSQKRLERFRLRLSCLLQHLLLHESTNHGGFPPLCTRPGILILQETLFLVNYNISFEIFFN